MLFGEEKIERKGESIVVIQRSLCTLAKAIFSQI